jgi:hypothetical protein
MVNAASTVLGLSPATPSRWKSWFHSHSLRFGGTLAAARRMSQPTTAPARGRASSGAARCTRAGGANAYGLATATTVVLPLAMLQGAPALLFSEDQRLNHPVLRALDSLQHPPSIPLQVEGRHFAQIYLLDRIVLTDIISKVFNGLGVFILEGRCNISQRMLLMSLNLKNPLLGT